MAALPDLFHLPKARTEAFSDGVIAINITVLVLELKIPEFEGPDVDRQLREAFAHDWHSRALRSLPCVFTSP